MEVYILQHTFTGTRDRILIKISDLPIGITHRYCLRKKKSTVLNNVN